MCSYRRFLCASVSGLVLLGFTASAQAADFTVNTGVTETNAQSLNADAETGTVNTNGTLSVNGAAISGSSTNLVITNSGIIEATGAGNSAIRFVTGNLITGTTITNNSTGTIRANGGGAARGIYIESGVYGGAGGMTVENYGTIEATGGTGNAVRFIDDDNILRNYGTLTVDAGQDAIYVDGHDNRIILQSGSTLNGGINFAGGSGNILEYWIGSENCPAGGGYCTVASEAPTVTGGTLNTEYTEIIHRLSSTPLAASTKVITVNGRKIAVTEDGAGANNDVVRDSTGKVMDVAYKWVRPPRTHNTIFNNLPLITIDIPMAVFNSSKNTLIDVSTLSDEQLVELFFSRIADFFDAVNYFKKHPIASTAQAQTDIAAKITLFHLITIINEIDYRKNTAEPTGVSSGDVVPSRLDEMRAEFERVKASLTPEQRAEIERLVKQVTDNPPDIYQAWAEVYGSYRERPDHGSASYSESLNGGVVAGINLPEPINGVQYGFYVSGFTGSTDIGKNTFRTIDTNGLLIGGVASKNINDYMVSGQLALGYSNSDSDREVGGGGGTAKADYDAYWMNPSATISRDFIWGTVTYTPSFTGGYTLTRTSSYDEHGSTANQSVDSKTSHMVNARVQVEAKPLPTIVADRGILSPALRVGVEGSTDFGDRTIDVRVLNTNVSIDPDADRAVDGLIGINLNYLDRTGVNVYFDGETNIGLNKGGPQDNMGAAVKVGLRWAF